MKRMEGQRTKVNKASTRPDTDSDSSLEDESAHRASRVTSGLFKVSKVSTAKTRKVATLARDTPRLLTTVVHRGGSFTFKCLPDTGATVSVLSSDLATRFNMKVKPSVARLFACDDSELSCVGTTSFRVEGERINALVSDSIRSDVLISWHDMVRLGVLPADFPSLPRSQVRAVDQSPPQPCASLLSEFKDVFSDSLPAAPMAGPPMTIELVDDKPIQPKKVYIARPVPIHWQDQAKQFINSLVNDGVY